MLSICLEVRFACLSACSLEKTLKKATALPSVIVNCSEEEYDWTQSPYFGSLRISTTPKV